MFVIKSLICAAALLQSVSAQTKRVSCENIGQSKTDIKCNMLRFTRIDSMSYEISPPTNKRVDSLDFSFNENISYLPTGLRRVFPELKSIDADFCSIRVILRDNFAGLKNLKYLDLDGNKIEKIDLNTFDDLVTLKKLMLSKLKLFSLFQKRFSIFFYFFRLQPN